LGGGLVAEPVAVFLEAGTAAGGIDDDGVALVRAKGGDVGAGAVACPVHVPAVGVEGAATFLAAGVTTS